MTAGKSQERECKVQHCLNLSLSSALLSRFCSGIKQGQVALLKAAGLRTALSGKGGVCPFIFVNRGHFIFSIKWCSL